MKVQNTLRGYSLKSLSLFCGVLLIGSSIAVDAAPRGPSARAAAKLKKSPPNTWIKHYLPDDRYKIAGGVWKYVTTDTNRYYHRPDSPLMLRQSPNYVIGFSSAKDAEEAGYLPHPSDGTMAAIASQSSAGLAKAGGKSTSVAGGVRWLLADGGSTVTLPAGWRRTVSQRLQQDKSILNVDHFLTPAGEKVNMVKMNLSVPQGIGVESFLNPQFFNQMKTHASKPNAFDDTTSGVVNSQVSRFASTGQKFFSNMNVYRVRFAGMEGVGVTFRNKASISPLMAQAADRAFMVGRGSTMVVVEDYSRSGKAAMPLLKGLKVKQ